MVHSNLTYELISFMIIQIRGLVNYTQKINSTFTFIGRCTVWRKYSIRFYSILKTDQINLFFFFFRMAIQKKFSKSKPHYSWSGLIYCQSLNDSDMQCSTKIARPYFQRHFIIWINADKFTLSTVFSLNIDLLFFFIDFRSFLTTALSELWTRILYFICVYKISLTKNQN